MKNIWRNEIMKSNTLYDVKVGDQVLWIGHHNKRILTITRLTKTTIVCGYEKFRKSDGRCVPSDPWSMSFIEVLTPEKRLQLETQKKHFQLAQKCSKAPYHLFSIDILESISNLIDQENQNIKKSCLTQ